MRQPAMQQQCNKNATAAAAHLVALKAGCVLHYRQLCCCCCCCCRSCLCQLGQVRVQLILQLQGSGGARGPGGTGTYHMTNRGGAASLFI